jgi:predicted metal-dependent hydrolase
MGGDPGGSVASGREMPGGASPEFTVRTSTRARNVRLVMSANDGLVVVIPRGFDRRGIPEILERRAAWIERAMARVETRCRMLGAGPLRIPDRVALAAVGEEWTLERRSGPPASRGVRVREQPGQRLLLSGEVHDFGGCQEALYRWLGRKAREVLVPVVVEMARLHGFEVSRVSVRRQRTRWASCSRRKTISLNLKLLFLPPDIVEYVLLHELCHTVRLDHSRAFWALMEAHDPNYRVKNRRLRDAWKALPAWLASDGVRPALD